MIFASILNLLETVIGCNQKCYGHIQPQSGFAFKDATISIHFSIRLRGALLYWSRKCCIIPNSLFKSVNFHLWTKHLLFLILAMKGVSVSTSEGCHLKDLISWCTQVTGYCRCSAPELFLIWFLCPNKRFGFKFVGPIWRRKWLCNIPIWNKLIGLLMRRCSTYLY